MFTDQHKDKIRDIILASAELFGIHLINYVVMANHFHILVQVPEKVSLPKLTSKSLLKQTSKLYSPDYVTDLKQQLQRAADHTNPETAAALTDRILERYDKRRANLSEFMKEVKQRITYYINAQYKRAGTLWEGRFKSPIVERTSEAILAISTYIDLNPIRAGIVERPEDYRWCGYAAALSGNRKARKGICSIYALNDKPGSRLPSWNSIKSEYRQYLFEKGIEILADESNGFKGRKGFTAEEVEQEIARRGELPLHEVICHRVRYFSDGVAIGSATFVNRVFEQNRAQLVSKDSLRQTGARRMRGAKWGGLTSLRDLRNNVIGLPS